MIRIAHLSDLHISTQPPHWSAFFDRRLSGALNLTVGRRRHGYKVSGARGAKAVAQILAEAPDAVVFGGDASSLSETEELQGAAEVLKPLLQMGVPCYALAGNHDRYTHRSVRQKRFEKAFADWELIPSGLTVVELGGETIGLADTAQANRGIWDSRGQILDLPERLPGLIFSHYGLILPDGEPDKHWHGLRNGPAVVNRLSEGQQDIIWCCGHIHHSFEVRRGNLTQFCAGSVGGPAASWQMITIDGMKRHRTAWSADASADDLDR